MKKITIVFSKMMLLLALLINFEALCKNVYFKKINHVSLQSSFPSLAPMLEKVMPAVISINVEGKITQQEFSIPPQLEPFCQKDSPFYNSPFCHIPNTSEKKDQYFNALGSGVIINAHKGYAVTNYHIVENTYAIHATLNDGRCYEVRVIGKDKHADIALIQLLDADNLSEIRISDSDLVRVGDYTIAIGNPYGLGETVTSGIVSALGRSGLHIEHYENFIQTDASINRGNSGGALLNVKGELIGINTAILAPEGGSIGIAFSIPINIVKNLTEQMALFGEVKRGELGIVAIELNPDLSEIMKVNTHQGAFVSQVMSNSSASKAGVKAGDIIIALNNKKIASFSSLRAELGSFPVGTRIILGILRHGKSVNITLELKNAVHNAMLIKDMYPGLEGIQVSNHVLHNKTFVKVDNVKFNTRAFSIGFKKNDIILSVNQVLITDLKELKKILDMKPNTLVFSIKRGRNYIYLVSH